MNANHDGSINWDRECYAEQWMTPWHHAVREVRAKHPGAKSRRLEDGRWCVEVEPGRVFVGDDEARAWLAAWWAR
jgi:hypothetical protein